jgi:hypothetical protein
LPRRRLPILGAAALAEIVCDAMIAADAYGRAFY